MRGTPLQSQYKGKEMKFTTDIYKEGRLKSRKKEKSRTKNWIVFCLENTIKCWRVCYFFTIKNNFHHHSRGVDTFVA